MMTAERVRVRFEGMKKNSVPLTVENRLNRQTDDNIAKKAYQCVEEMQDARTQTCETGRYNQCQIPGVDDNHF